MSSIANIVFGSADISVQSIMCCHFNTPLCNPKIFQGVCSLDVVWPGTLNNNSYFKDTIKKEMLWSHWWIHMVVWRSYATDFHLWVLYWRIYCITCKIYSSTTYWYRLCIVIRWTVNNFTIVDHNAMTVPGLMMTSSLVNVFSITGSMCEAPLICNRPITCAGLILGLRAANDRRRYFVTTSLIGWAQA